ncbi:pancreatic triacylglycerol lipase-like [Lycorma delicatula]|uniref:pancreatic triacylglycerol lipase-like n=1 Tax=Lycorma delicatula TaxID=130591 RepID=UPI003F513E0D
MLHTLILISRLKLILFISVLATLCSTDVFAENSQKDGTVLIHRPTAGLPKRIATMGASIRESLARHQERMQERRNRSRKEICYELLGCFPMAISKHQPLKKTPQPPAEVDTKFWLFTRGNQSEPTQLFYGDKRESIVKSSYDSRKKTRILVHGFKGSGMDFAARAIGNLLMKLEDSNVILTDWEKGAAGPSYAVAAANTQLVGRQLALLLLDMTSLGTQAKDIHIIGFSLGAHIAGFAGRAIQQRGLQLGRITGLDPASPLFRQHLKASLPPLTTSDAQFVDILHTDAARTWTNGFGLFKPIGHVDFFPNGGKDQPGCAHYRASLIVSHLEGTVNSSVICNHVRAFRYFLESMQAEETGCEYKAFPCPNGYDAFQSGLCFPEFCNTSSTDGSCSVMGYYSVNNPARGPMYLVTRDKAPFCGEQLRATVLISQRTQRTRGYLQLSLEHGNEFTSFQLYSELSDAVKGGIELNALATAKFGSINEKLTPDILANFSFHSLSFQNPNNSSLPDSPVHIARVIIQSLNGVRWQYCGEDATLGNKDGSPFHTVTLPLKVNSC